MTSHVERSQFEAARAADLTYRESAGLRYLVPLGRLLFSGIFIMSLLSHFKPQLVAHAAQHGVPMANILVPLSGILAGLGGLSILLGFRARIGAWMIVAFLVPVTLMMHAFWNETDPMITQMQMANFIKNLSLLGGALLIAYFGSGPISLDSRLPSALRRPVDRVV
jgi:putative oxidoreductase